MSDAAPKGSPGIRRYALLLLKLFISSTLLYLLISRIGGSAILGNVRLLNPLSFLGAVALYLLAAYLSTLRWKLLVPCTVGTRRLFSMYMIGSFFNTYLPGGIGGDAVKAYYLSREMIGRQKSGSDRQCPAIEAPLTIAVASVFMDRYIGFGALLLIGMTVFPFGISLLESASSSVPVLWAIPSLLILFIAATIVIFKFSWGRQVQFLQRAYQYFHTHTIRRDTLVTALLYSVALQLLGIIAVYVLAKGLSLNISFLSLLVFLPIIIVFSMIPVSISGIGLREGAFVFLLGGIGVPPERSFTLSLVWFSSVFVAGLWGLFEYLRFKTVLGGKEE
ncbi:MAG: lysylphosphatidylglycerol synthase transmembrane domain-containing protein [Nitrospirota bacterium]